jgi:hypothetical protein
MFSGKLTLNLMRMMENEKLLAVYNDAKNEYVGIHSNPSFRNRGIFIDISDYMALTIIVGKSKYQLPVIPYGAKSVDDITHWLP